MSEWIEVNIAPPQEGNPEELLLDVVEPLVHGELGEKIERWFYFWEPELRLRLRWREEETAEANREAVRLLLAQAQEEGKLELWWEGNHGVEGEQYIGEADFYGEEVWDLTSKDWMAGSELALAIARLEAEGRLSQPRAFHWARRVHLFSNQLRQEEIALCLRQADGYIRMHFGGDPRFDELLAAIERVLSP